MDDEANSWIRRAKFSHTVYHRLDSARLASYRIDLEPIRLAGVKTRPPKTHEDHKPVQILANHVPNKYRTVTPPPKTMVPDTFKEAKSNAKRFSTPHPQRVESEKEYKGKKTFHRNMTTVDLKSPRNGTTSPLKHFNSMKISGKRKMKRDYSWSKLFDHGGGKVISVEMVDDHMVDLSKLFLGHRFAHGANSQLYHGIYKDEAVAVKIIRVPDDDENEELVIRLENQFAREVNLLSRLHHQNVIKFVAACRQPLVFCIITEYLSEGSLRAYLHKLEDNTDKEKEYLPLKKLIKMALDIARGMEYIHSQGVIHRDLKPENILINEDFELKIADFGIGCEEAYCDFLADDPGTYRWMAPEMIKQKSYCRKVDVYGFGLILWEMVAGTIPYKDMTPIQAAFAVVHKNLRPTVPANSPPPMRALIEQCWSSHPEKRPEFSQVVKVLEKFESLVARDGNLNLLQHPTCLDHKKGLHHSNHKPGPHHLRAYLHKLENNTDKEKEYLPLEKLIKMALDIARGMEFIHSQGVIYRDLKPENILINEDFQLKIADFGIGCEEAYCDFLADDPGTYRWMAPEMIKRKSYCRKVDVYGFGLILWEMVAGTIPYKDMTPVQAAFAVVHKNLRPTVPANCPPAIRALIKQCWSSHPEKRPEFWQVVKVLEEFESSVARDGNLDLLQHPACLDQKKGLRHWIQKLGPHHHHHHQQSNSHVPKPRFS